MAALPVTRLALPDGRTLAFRAYGPEGGPETADTTRVISPMDCEFKYQQER